MMMVGKLSWSVGERLSQDVKSQDWQRRRIVDRHTMLRQPAAYMQAQDRDAKTAPS